MGEPSSDDTSWAVGAHLSSLSGLLIPFGTLLGPLTVWLLRRKQGDFFSTEHAKEALNFNLSLLLYQAVLLVLAVGGMVALVGGAPAPGERIDPSSVLQAAGGFVVGLLCIIVGPIFWWLVLTIVAAVKASSGLLYHYPLTIRFLRGPRG